jgi:hypothetical protein
MAVRQPVNSKRRMSYSDQIGDRTTVIFVQVMLSERLSRSTFRFARMVDSFGSALAFGPIPDQCSLSTDQSDDRETGEISKKVSRNGQETKFDESSTSTRLLKSSVLHPQPHLAPFPRCGVRRILSWRYKLRRIIERHASHCCISFHK